ncbi:MAG: LamG-like jellyroll fold domain-containing protein, partial [Flavobacteriales bacterium]
MRKLLLFFGMASSVAFSQIPTNGLQFHYSFNTGSAIDASGNNNNGTANNITYTNDRFGNTSSAAVFNGTNAYIAPPNSMLSSAAVSVSIWIKTANNNRPILGQQSRAYPSGGNTHVPVLYLRNNGQLNAGFWTGSQRNLNTSTTNLANSQWHHIVISADGSGQDIYIDGVNTRTNGNARQNLNMIYSAIGAARTSSWPGITAGTMRYFSGEMDDVRVYNRTLTSSEVTTLFNEVNITIPNFQQTVAEYSFNAANTRDTSGNGNHATGTNVTYTADRFGNANHAANFNTGTATNAYITLPNNSFLKTELSLSAWFKTTSVGEVLISYQSNAIGIASGAFVPVAYVRTDSTLNVGFWRNSITNSVNVPTKVADNAWHHLVISIGSTGQDIYLDDSLINTSPNTHNILQMPNTYLGGGATTNWPNIASGTQYFSGAMDDFKLYNLKLDSSDVTQLFNESDPMNPTVFIPDSIFKACLLADTAINLNGDGEVQIAEAVNFTGTLTCPTGTPVTNFQGIENFTDITGFAFNRHNSNTLDFSQNTQLRSISSSITPLQQLNISGLFHLKTLNIQSNKFNSINLSTNDSLEILWLQNNSVNSIDVSNLTQLKSLRFSNDSTLQNVDLNNLDSLSYFEAINMSAGFDSLDLSGKSKLDQVNVFGSGLSYFDISNSNNISTLRLEMNQLDTIDLSNHTELEILYLSNNNQLKP